MPAGKYDPDSKGEVLVSWPSFQGGPSRIGEERSARAAKRRALIRNMVELPVTLTSGKSSGHRQADPNRIDFRCDDQNVKRASPPVDLQPVMQKNGRGRPSHSEDRIASHGTAVRISNADMS